MNSPLIPKGDSQCLFSHGSESFDQLIDTSSSSTNYLVYVLLLKHLSGNVPWGNGAMNKGKATISKTLESTVVIGSGWG